jgi:leucyl-tRNA synthetase
MADRYDPKPIEGKWQARWEASQIYRAHAEASRPKYYVLTMYPYPSGDLHVGHLYNYAPADAGARFMRMRGYNVLFPMGFDAFGLPAENAALQRGIHPQQWTRQNIEKMRRQFREMGGSFDWSRDIVTCDPEYYRWNQWFFLEFFKRGLAYKALAAVDWCPNCHTTLAREQVIGEGRVCERCETPVARRMLDQWFFRTTAYAEELLDCSELDWPERVIAMQRNWIGRSDGVEFDFRVAGTEHAFRVFTTRPDTVFGATFCVLAPEHPLVAQITPADRRAAVEAYVAQATRRTEIERLSTERERTGVFTGALAVNPMNGEEVPIWVADYVLMTYGTGAIMAVPAHDERDFDFARRHDLPIRVVIAPPDWNDGDLDAASTGAGTMVHSGKFDGLPSLEGWQRIADEMEKADIGQRKVNYRLRDWLISRQRYWGTPIPILYCEKCGMQPVPESDLPVVLPLDVEFRPTGESPLKFSEQFRRATCPGCGGPAERETDTMDTFVDSSWYWYRYLAPHDDTRPFDPAAASYWCPVDQYIGGAEHAVMHLLYARFFNRVLRDIGLIEFNEPFRRLFNQGMILAPVYRDAMGRVIAWPEVEWKDGQPHRRATGELLDEAVEKMSKSKRNVVDPDEMFQTHGADALRVFEMFLGPWDQGGPWTPRGIEGPVRFLNRAWAVVTEPTPAAGGAPSAEEIRELRQAGHRTLKKVTVDLERFAYNTAVAALMEYVNVLTRARQTAVASAEAWSEARRLLTLMLAPLAPHIAEEMWERIGQPYSVHQQAWPIYDEELAAEQMVEVVIQVNGRVREHMVVPAGLAIDEVEREALALPKIRALMDGRTIRKVVVVPDRLVNVVVG